MVDKDRAGSIDDFLREADRLRMYELKSDLDQEFHGIKADVLKARVNALEQRYGGQLQSTPEGQYLSALVSHYNVESKVRVDGSSLTPEQKDYLDRTIADMDLTQRAHHCLEQSKIGFIHELVQYTEENLLALRSFGRTSLREVKRNLSERGLILEMTLGDYQPPEK